MFKIYEVWVGSLNLDIKIYDCKKETEFYYISNEGYRISKGSSVAMCFSTLEEAKKYALEFIDRKEKALKNSREIILAM